MICHLELLVVSFNVEVLEESRACDHFFTLAHLLSLFDSNFGLEGLETGISCDLHGQLIVLVVNPGLVKNIKFLYLVLAVVFLWDPD